MKTKEIFIFEKDLMKEFETTNFVFVLFPGGRIVPLSRLRVDAAAVRLQTAQMLVVWRGSSYTNCSSIIFLGVHPSEKSQFQ